MKITNAKLRSLPIGKKVSDGGGLYYQPTAPNKGKWSYRFAMDGKSHEMGLGIFPEISLKEARLAHAEQRKMFSDGKTRKRSHGLDGLTSERTNSFFAKVLALPRCRREHGGRPTLCCELRSKKRKPVFI